MKPPKPESATRPVGRARSIPGIEVPRSLYQDPRFDSALGDADFRRARKNYAFLDEYREHEIQELERQLEAAEDLEERNIIAKALKSLKSRLETLHRRDFEGEVLKKIGSKKISRAKKREIVLKERYAGMKSTEVARAIEKRKVKLAQKQKKALPYRRS